MSVYFQIPLFLIGLWALSVIVNGMRAWRDARLDERAEAAEQRRRDRQICQDKLRQIAAEKLTAFRSTPAPSLSMDRVVILPQRWCESAPSLAELN